MSSDYEDSRPLTPPIPRIQLRGGLTPVFQEENVDPPNPLDTTRPFYLFNKFWRLEMRAWLPNDGELSRSYIATKTLWVDLEIWDPAWDRDLLPGMEWPRETREGRRAARRAGPRPETPQVGSMTLEDGRRLPLVYNSEAFPPYRPNASRPYWMFMRMWKRESFCAYPTVEQRLKAYENVRDNWKELGIWMDGWDETLIPGMKWEREM